MYKIMPPPPTPFHEWPCDWYQADREGLGWGCARRRPINIWAKTNQETIPAAPAAGRPAFAPDTGPCSCHPGRAHCWDAWKTKRKKESWCQFDFCLLQPLSCLRQRSWDVRLNHWSGHNTHTECGGNVQVNISQGFMLKHSRGYTVRICRTRRNTFSSVQEWHSIFHGSGLCSNYTSQIRGMMEEFQVGLPR